MSGLDAPSAALVRVALALGNGSQDELASRMRAARDAGVSAEWLEELLLNAVLLVGFPRTLIAAAALRTVQPVSGGLGDATDYDRWPDWQARGEATCRQVYGRNYDKLRENVRALHPALEAWVMTDGYGRIISRPALPLKLRELCTIAALVPQNAPMQIHSHFRGALNNGASPGEIEDVLELAASWPGNDSWLGAVRAQWAAVRGKLSTTEPRS